MPDPILHVETFGDPSADDAVLAVHGVTGFGARFARLASRLPDRRWLCPDLRGHGRSPAPAPWRTEEHVADQLAVLDAHELERADVVAHSFGGHVALHLLATAPDRVGRVALVDPASLLDPHRVHASALAYAREPGWATRDDALGEVSGWFPTEGSRPDLDLEVARNLAQDDAGRWRMRYSPVVIVAAYGEMCRALPPLPDDHDVLLLEAEEGRSSVTDALRSALTDAFGGRLRREVVAGAGHVVFRTHLDETAGAVGRLLGEVSPGGT
ncbi:MAG TPA: alpha/beta fold hydrolase [Acidimicrobiales bacterium]|nr:alpha/beta fold hydrolase [Acidimicrobiales bacterium]